MGMQAGGGGGGLQSEINVTPMVDVMLVLADHLHGGHAFPPTGYSGRRFARDEKSGRRPSH